MMLIINPNESVEKNYMEKYIKEIIAKTIENFHLLTLPFNFKFFALSSLPLKSIKQ
jgi:hypothetical protein